MGGRLPPPPLQPQRRLLPAITLAHPALRCASISCTRRDVPELQLVCATVVQQRCTGRVESLLAQDRQLGPGRLVRTSSQHRQKLALLRCMSELCRRVPRAPHVRSSVASFSTE